jgi:hypothetical protein
VVVILTGSASAPGAASSVGRALATRVRWRFDDAHALPELHQMVARALERRERTVIAAGPELDARECERLRELRSVRFVQLVTGAAPHPSFADLIVETEPPIESSVAAIRKEFGL